MSCIKFARTAFFRALDQGGVFALSDEDIIISVITGAAKAKGFLNDYLTVNPVLACLGLLGLSGYVDLSN